MCLEEINAGKKHGQLLPCNLPCLRFRLRPRKLIFFKTLLPQAETVALPIQRFYQRPVPIAEYKDITRQRFLFHLFNNIDGKGVDLFSHVRDTRLDVYL